MQVQDLHIETIASIDGFRAHQDLQVLVWGYDPREVVPVRLLIALARHGGVVLGAYSGETMVGLLLSLLAEHNGQRVHLSYMLGVHPAWRGRGIGSALKWRQRALVLARGITQIVWTYDPLEAANARLNLAHLGGRVRTYTDDYYGPLEDDLNRGLPSDRFVVEWDLNAPHVCLLAEGRGSREVSEEWRQAPLAVSSVVGEDGLRRPTPFIAPAELIARIEIPADMRVIKRSSTEAALAWRRTTREAFGWLFGAGYVVVDAMQQGGHVFYCLAKDRSYLDESRHR